MINVRVNCGARRSLYFPLHCLLNYVCTHFKEAEQLKCFSMKVTFSTSTSRRWIGVRKMAYSIGSLVLVLYFVQIAREVSYWATAAKTNSDNSMILDQASLAPTNEDVLITPPGLQASNDMYSVLHRKQYLKQLRRAPNLVTLETWAYQFNQFPPLNHHKFQTEPDFIPIVLLVHQRTSYLKHVIEQYRNVVNISKTMLIISHDGVDPGMPLLLASFGRG